LIKPHDIERADRWFERHGDWAVLSSRLLPVIRTFISLPAGVARMPFLRFSVLTLVGCLPWSFALTAAGYLLGENWERILPYTEPITYFIAVVVAIMGVMWLVRRVRSAREASLTSRQ
jgi:membrane protein DedA with SNARE-associated domain